MARATKPSSRAWLLTWAAQRGRDSLPALIDVAPLRLVPSTVARVWAAIVRDGLLPSRRDGSGESVGEGHGGGLPLGAQTWAKPQWTNNSPPATSRAPPSASNATAWAIAFVNPPSGRLSTLWRSSPTAEEARSA